jgi:PAS domain S-box-containing protein
MRRDGRIQEFNGAAERVFGYRKHEVLGRPLVDLVIPIRLRDAHRRGVARYLSTGTPGILGKRLELPALRADGTEFPVELTITVVGTPEEPTFIAFLRDLSAEHRAAQALRDSRSLLAAVVEGATDAIYVKDVHGRYLTVNAAGARLLGRSVADVVGRHDAELLSPGDAERIALEERAVMYTGQSRTIENTMTIAGVARTLLSMKAPYRDDGGNVRGVLAISRDMTERTQLEETLVTSEARYRVLYDEASEMYLSIEVPGGRIVDCNRTLIDALGYRRDELLGRPYVELFRVQDQPMVQSILVRFGDTGLLPVVDLEVVRRDGSRLWVRGSASAFRDASGRITTGHVIWRDVGELRRAGEAQRFLAEATTLLAGSLEYEDTLRAIAQLAVPAVASACLVDLAEPGEPLRQIAAASLQGDQVVVAPGGLPVAYEVAQHGVLRTIQTGEPEVYPSLTRSDPMAPLGIDHPELFRHLGARSYLCVPIKFHEQAIGAMTLLSTGARFDGTSLALIAELGRRISVAIENARLYRQAEVAVAARDEFLSIASHELRTPLSTLVLQHAAIQDELTDLPVEDPAHRFDRKLGRAVRQTERLSQLITGLLDVSWMSAGNLKLQLERFDLAGEIRDLADQLGGLADRAGCTLEVHASTEAVGEWDRIRIDQVITNLLANAFKYGAGAPVAIDVEVEPPRVRISIQDHGIGIPRADIDRIFGRFERAVSLRAFEGLGLGLFIARRIVEAHGGSICVDSEPGRGSTFTVSLLTSAAPASR